MALKAQTSNCSQFYTLNRDRFVTAFGKVRQAVIDHISRQSAPEAAMEIGNEAALYFEEILTKLPYVGGDVHPGTQFIVNAGQWVAVYHAMIKREFTELEVAKMMYSIHKARLSKIPSEELKNQNASLFSEAYIQLIKQWTEDTSAYECDWKADFIKGDGISFDYGLNYRTCPCFELFKAHNAKQLAPFFCLLDFPEAKQLGSGLVRTKTLAQGDDVCNFRYKKGREVVQNWNTEVEKILEAVSKSPQAKD